MQVGLIAGAGRLPEILRARCSFSYVLDLKASSFPLGAMERAVDLLLKADCDGVCFAGHVSRDDFDDLDQGGLWVQAQAGEEAGDARLLDAVVAYCEGRGLHVVGAADLRPELVTPKGVLAGARIEGRAGLERARDLGARDLGQAVVRVGETLWLEEDRAGTDALLERAAEYEAATKVLFKAAKPQQDLRMDMPAWGPETVKNAAKAGVRGLVFEAGKTLALDLDVALQDAVGLGVSIVGVSL